MTSLVAASGCRSALRPETDARDALEVVAARREPLDELLDTLKAVQAVGGGVLLIVLIAEVAEVLVRI